MTKPSVADPVDDTHRPTVTHVQCTYTKAVLAWRVHDRELFAADLSKLVRDALSARSVDDVSRAALEIDSTQMDVAGFAP